MSEAVSKKRLEIKNKEDRIQRVCERFDKVEEDGVLRPAEAASLRGVLQYCSAQVFGGAAVLGLKPLGALACSGPTVVDVKIRKLFAFWRKYLQACRPRLLELDVVRPPINVFTDAALEEVEGAGAAAVLMDPEDGALLVLAGAIREEVVKRWQVQVGGKQVICQAELLPLLAAQHTWRDRLKGRRVIFVYNDAAKDGLIRRYSPSEASHELIEAFWLMEAELASLAWVERVPSKSNPADDPSRGVLRRLLAAGAVLDVAVLPPPWRGALVDVRAGTK